MYPRQAVDSIQFPKAIRTHLEQHYRFSAFDDHRERQQIGFPKPGWIDTCGETICAVHLGPWRSERTDSLAPPIYTVMNTFICTKCDISKNKDQFPIRKYRGNLRFRRTCRSCETQSRFVRATSDSMNGQKRKQRETRYIEQRRLYSQTRRTNPRLRANNIRTDSLKSDKRRGFDNDLTIDFINSLIANPCSYCGDDELMRTLDRIDNNIGHIQTNVVCACIRCNYMKRDMPHEAWIALVSAVRAARIAGLFKDWTGQARRKCQRSAEDSNPRPYGPIRFPSELHP